MKESPTLLVNDPFGVAGDPEMPSLSRALDPLEAEPHLRQCLGHLAGDKGCIYLRDIRVTRYKPGQRCLIEYAIDIEDEGGDTERMVVIGKVRAQHRAKVGNRLLGWLWDAGFSADSADGISVPEPLGVIREFQMWLQRKVSGRMATDFLAGEDGVRLARRIAEAAVKLHRARVRTRRRHTMIDELRILHERLPKAGQDPERIQRVLDGCVRLGSSIPEPVTCGIHRDFYSDQIIVDEDRIYLIDFDLHCEGDPGLDIGNFTAHITEHSLRTHGDPEALSAVEKAMEERFVELSGEQTRPAIRAYHTLTLARHIYLSTLKPERRRFTTTLLDLCEQRLRSKNRNYVVSLVAP